MTSKARPQLMRASTKRENDDENPRKPRTAPAATVTAPVRRERICHGYLQSEALAAYTRKEFISSNLTDVDFAEKATGALSFRVTASHVFAVRHELGFPSRRDSNQAVNGRGGPVIETLLTRIAALEKALTLTQTK